MSTAGSESAPAGASPQVIDAAGQICAAGRKTRESRVSHPPQRCRIPRALLTFVRGWSYFGRLATRTQRDVPGIGERGCGDGRDCDGRCVEDAFVIVRFRDRVADSLRTN